MVKSQHLLLYMGNEMARILLFCLLLFYSRYLLAQDITCTTIGNTTTCNERPKMKDMTGAFQNQVDGAAMYRAYLEGQKRAQDRKEQELRMQLLQQQQNQLNTNQPQAPVYLGSDPNGATVYEKKCGPECCMYAGISKGMGNARAFSVLSEKLKLTGYGESTDCQNTINHYTQWGAEISKKSAAELTSQDIDTISAVKAFEAEF